MIWRIFNVVMALVWATLALVIWWRIFSGTEAPLYGLANPRWVTFGVCVALMLNSIHNVRATMDSCPPE